MQIAFREQYYNEPADIDLKMRLLEFFNHLDVQKKLEAGARHIFPDLNKNVKPAQGYPMASVGLTVFGLTEETDGNPYNLCAALIHAAVCAKKDKTMDRVTLTGLNSCAKQMLSIVHNYTNNSSLKSNILQLAAQVQLTFDKGVV